MKSINITIAFDDEKLAALKRYMSKKELDLDHELTDALVKLYEKYVPAPVREYDDPDYLELLRLVTSIDCNWKYGFDTCQSPAIYKFAPSVAIESIEFCEAARFSMYINSRCIAFPCSFGIEDETFSVNLKQHSLQEAWESESFAKFREKQTKVCANCSTGICRSCGLELGLNLCGNIQGNLQ